MSEGNVHRVDAMREERERLQKRIDEIESRIRRRLRGKFREIGRGVYDLDDVLASARRRIDVAALAGRIRAQSVPELDAFILSVAEHVAIDALRHENRHRLRQLTVLAGNLSVNPGLDPEPIDESLWFAGAVVRPGGQACAGEREPAARHVPATGRSGRYVRPGFDR
jgi:DNA-directed RNA polymerase specialized sigma24 family protein